MRKKIVKKGIEKVLVAVMAVTLLATGTFGAEALLAKASDTTYTFDNTNPVKERGNSALGVFDFGVFAKNYAGNIHVASNIATENWTTNSDLLITNQYNILGDEVNYIANYTGGGFAEDVMPIQVHRKTALYVVGDQYSINYQANQIRSGETFVGDTNNIAAMLHQSDAFTIDFDNALTAVENWAKTAKYASVAQSYDWGQEVQTNSDVAILNIKSSQLLENYKSATGEDVNSVDKLFESGINTVIFNVEVDAFPTTDNGLFLKNFHSNYPNNIMWNFGSYAGELIFNRDFAGTVVAPRATVILNQFLDGAVIATTFGNIGCEIHGYLFNGKLTWANPTEAPADPTEVPVVPTEVPVVPTEEPVVPTEVPVVPTEAPVVPTETPVVPTEAPVVPTEVPVVPTEAPVVPTEAPVVPTEVPVVPTEPPVVPTEVPVVPTEVPVVPTETPVVPTEVPVVPTEAPVVSTPVPVVPTEAPVVPTQAPVVPTEAPVVPTEAPVVPTEAPVVPTEAPVVPTEAPVVPTQAPAEPTATPAAADRQPTSPTQAPANPTEAPAEQDTPVADTNPTDPADPDDNEVLGQRRTRDGVVTIEDDEVPLSDAAVLGSKRRPKTGDASDLWALVLVSSVAGLAAWVTINRKK